jgi:2-desacetyl-2-hydroxyethyl bacteriochlorophyllide A dehydrogenase
MTSGGVNTMQAAVLTRARHLEMRELRIPDPGPGEVRVRVGATGVCGTDLHLFEGHFGAVFPLTPGHEIAGVVDAVGAGVSLLEGERVALDPVISCGHCHHCKRGARHHCLNYAALGVTRAGGFAEYVIAPAANAYPVGNLSLEVAAFAEPLGCVVWGIERLQTPLASSALLFGAGPIGLLLMQALLASGVASVAVVEPSADRRAVALKLGARVALAPGADLGVHLRDLEPYGFDIVTEATGIPSVLEGLLEYAAPLGKVLYYGVPPEQARISVEAYQVFRRDLTILGSFSLLGTVPKALAWLETGRVRVEELISHRLPIGDLATALAYKDHPGMAGSQKVLIVPNGHAH